MVHERGEILPVSAIPPILFELRLGARASQVKVGVHLALMCNRAVAAPACARETASRVNLHEAEHAKESSNSLKTLSRLILFSPHERITAIDSTSSLERARSCSSIVSSCCARVEFTAHSGL